MNKKLLSFLVLMVLGFSVLVPTGRVLAQTGGLSIEDLQKQINQLTELIKNLQNQLNNLRGQTQPVKPIEQEVGWEKISGLLIAQGADGLLSVNMWGTHKITEPTLLTYPTQGGKSYLVKAVNDEVLALLKKYEGQNVILWGQLQYQNLEGGFWGFVAHKVYQEGYSCAIPASARIGYAGDDVKVIQTYLATDKTIYPEGLVTGYYGTLTKKAVERYQQKNGLMATGEVSGVTAEKLEIAVETHPTFVCPIPPRPIPPPIPNQGLKVYSPSNGETWVPGQTYKIAWNQVWPTIIGSGIDPGVQPTMGVAVSQLPASVAVANTSFAPIGAVRITLHHYVACLYEGPVRCLMAEAMPYVIAEKTDNDGIFEWAIPVEMAKEYRDSKLIIMVSAVDGGMSGRSGVFTIGSGTNTGNLPPVVSGVGGPTSLKVGETGTWTVKAYDPENGNLGYTVNWGDDQKINYMGVAVPEITSVQNLATFTHIYGYSGTFNPVFYVVDDRGGQAKTSMSVVVGGSTEANTNTPPKIVSVSPVLTYLRAGQAMNFWWLAKDGDGDKLTWSIDWGDGGLVPGAGMCPPNLVNYYDDGCYNFSAAHVWNSPGTYTVKATATDTKGGYDTFSFTLIVSDF